MNRFFALTILLAAFGSWAQSQAIPFNIYIQERQKRMDSRLFANDNVPEYLFSAKQLFELALDRLKRGELRATNSYTKTFLENGLATLSNFNADGYGYTSVNFVTIVLGTVSQLEEDLSGEASSHLIKANHALASNLLTLTSRRYVGDLTEAVPLLDPKDFYPLALNYLNFIKLNQQGTHPASFLCVVAQLQNHVVDPHGPNRPMECPYEDNAYIESRNMFQKVHGLLLNLSPRAEGR